MQARTKFEPGDIVQLHGHQQPLGVVIGTREDPFPQPRDHWPAAVYHTVEWDGGKRSEHYVHHLTDFKAKLRLAQDNLEKMEQHLAEFLERRDDH